MNELVNTFNIHTAGSNANPTSYIGWYPNTQYVQPYQLPQFGIPPMNAYPYPIQPQEKQEPMRGLFEVFIVDPKSETVLHTGFIVANDEGSARMKAMRKLTLEGDPDLDDLDFIVRRLGDVRAKKIVQEVRTVK